MFKKVTVKPHLREGKPVSGHDRTITNGVDPADQAAAAAGAAAGVLGLAETTGEPIKVLVDRKGQKVNIYTRLSGLDLSGYDLRNLDFGNVRYLEDVNFSGAILDGVSMSEVSIKNCNFDGASFKGATINVDMITGSSFNGAKFDGATIDAKQRRFQDKEYGVEDCDFSGTSFQDVTINGVDFRSTSLAGSTITGAKLSKVWFGGCSLKEATIKDSQLNETSLVDVDLSGGVIDNCRINNSDIRFSSVEEIRKLFSTKKIKTSRARGLSIKNTVFTSASFIKSDLEGTTWQNVDMDKCRLEEVRLTGATLDEVQMRKTSIEKCDGRNQDYTKTSFAGVTFGENDNRSDFSGSDFSGSDLTDVVLGNTNVKGSKWIGTKVGGLALFPDAQNVQIISAPDAATKDQTENSYEHYSFTDAAAAKGYSDKQIEFLIISGAIEVRNNQSKLRQKADFDPSSQHIPVWSFQNLPNVE